MKDTTSDIELKQLEIFLSKSKSERFMIVNDLTIFGRKVLESSILQGHPGISSVDLKIEVFKRCYIDFFSGEELDRILVSMRNYLASHPVSDT